MTILFFMPDIPANSNIGFPFADTYPQRGVIRCNPNTQVSNSEVISIYLQQQHQGLKAI